MDLNVLGLCRRAGKLECGFNRVSNAIKHKKAMLVIVSEHLSEKTKKEAVYFATKYNCKLICTDYTPEELSKAVGFQAGIFAVTDQRLAEKISSMPTSKGDMQS